VVLVVVVLDLMVGFQTIQIGLILDMVLIERRGRSSNERERDIVSGMMGLNEREPEGMAERVGDLDGLLLEVLATRTTTRLRGDGDQRGRLVHLGYRAIGEGVTKTEVLCCPEICVRAGAGQEDHSYRTGANLGCRGVRNCGTGKTRYALKAAPATIAASRGNLICNFGSLLKFIAVEVVRECAWSDEAYYRDVVADKGRSPRHVWCPILNSAGGDGSVTQRPILVKHLDSTAASMIMTRSLQNVFFQLAILPPTNTRKSLYSAWDPLRYCYE
jgi:hypothetical protein